uniref:Uncharacterized protein n=1 Tax=Physcomitrium patens TaxID=3218 RepID=A0A2K1JZ69_PHYPA|nr:hypothetical protein PHYPA_013937 [Physcomitrium patens]
MVFCDSGVCDLYSTLICFSSSPREQASQPSPGILTPPGEQSCKGLFNSRMSLPRKQASCAHLSSPQGPQGFNELRWNRRTAAKSIDQVENSSPLQLYSITLGPPDFPIDSRFLFLFLGLLLILKGFWFFPPILSLFDNLHLGRGWGE